jgi:DNA mismatch endonuclease Vsr
MNRAQASSPEISRRMKLLKKSGTGIEVQVAGELRKRAMHYRKNVRGLPGRPDFANRSKRWAIFVNGCFWHHHTGCRRATIPKANRGFWIAKFVANRLRDARAIRALRASGFRVLLIWECQRESIENKLVQISEAGRVDR